MYKIFKKILISSFYILIILVLFSCAVNKNSIFSSYDFDYEYKGLENGMPYEEADVYFETNAESKPIAVASMKAAATGGVANTTQDIISKERKIIKNYSFNVQTISFDEAYNSLMNKINELSGIVDNSYFNNGNVKNTDRNVNINVRIPVLYVDNFVEYIESSNSKFNIIFKSVNQEDVTDNYNDNVLKITTLKSELNKLNDLMKKANKVDDLIQIENRIADVSFEIQRIENRIKDLDNHINYSNINLNIIEVRILTETEQQVPSWDKINQAFHKNFNDTINYVKSVLIYLFTHIPAICLMLIVLLLILIIISIVKKKLSKSSSRSVKYTNNKKIVDTLMKRNKKHTHTNVDIIDDTKISNNISHDDIEID